jgi:hypothetical protein
MLAAQNAHQQEVDDVTHHKTVAVTIAGMMLAGTALAEPLTDSDKSAFAAKMSASCAARYRLGYDEKGKPLRSSVYGTRNFKLL